MATLCENIARDRRGETRRRRGTTTAKSKEALMKMMALSHGVTETMRRRRAAQEAAAGAVNHAYESAIEVERGPEEGEAGEERRGREAQQNWRLIREVVMV